MPFLSNTNRNLLSKIASIRRSGRVNFLGATGNAVSLLNN